MLGFSTTRAMKKNTPAPHVGLEPTKRLLYGICTTLVRGATSLSEQKLLDVSFLYYALRKVVVSLYKLHDVLVLEWCSIYRS